MINPLVLYHSACVDGFASACVVASVLRGAGSYLPGAYGKVNPRDQYVSGRDVFIVDFSLDPADMVRIAQAARSFTWIDHHETSAPYVDIVRHGAPSGAVIRHDQTECGATLAWKTLMGYGRPLPEVLRYVRDRDLWLWKEPKSREINVALSAVWQSRWNEPAAHYTEFLTQDPWRWLLVGEVLLDQQGARVEQALSRGVEIKLLGHRALAVNATIDMSEIGHAAVDRGYDVAVIWYQVGPNEFAHSLRSGPNVNVARIAERFGGGGHAQAAGYTAKTPCSMNQEVA